VYLCVLEEDKNKEKWRRFYKYDKTDPGIKKNKMNEKKSLFLPRCLEIDSKGYHLLLPVLSSQNRQSCRNILLLVHISMLRIIVVDREN
jgi:hypothetical protein